MEPKSDLIEKEKIIFQTFIFEFYVTLPETNSSPLKQG